MERLEGIVGELESPPIIIGHSAGGVFTQILLDHGFGAAGVAINSAPTEGVKRIPLSQVRASFPVLKNPANRHRAVGLTFEQWYYTFTNGLPEAEGTLLDGHKQETPPLPEGLQDRLEVFPRRRLRLRTHLLRELRRCWIRCRCRSILGLAVADHR